MILRSQRRSEELRSAELVFPPREIGRPQVGHAPFRIGQG
jgi:hypothetical protein